MTLNRKRFKQGDYVQSLFDANIYYTCRVLEDQSEEQDYFSGFVVQSTHTTVNIGETYRSLPHIWFKLVSDPNDLFIDLFTQLDRLEEKL